MFLREQRECEVSETKKSHQKSGMRNVCMWAFCPSSKESVGKSTFEFSPREQISLSIFHRVRNGLAWNYHNASQRTCQTITQRKMTSATTRDALGMKNDCWLRLAASWFPPSECPLISLNLWTVTISAEVGLWESNKTAEQSSALSFFAKHTNTFWIDKTSILERHAVAVIQNERAVHFPRCEKHSGVWWRAMGWSHPEVCH